MFAFEAQVQPDCSWLTWELFRKNTPSLSGFVKRIAVEADGFGVTDRASRTGGKAHGANLRNTKPIIP